MHFSIAMHATLPPIILQFFGLITFNDVEASRYIDNCF
jgi:hypothetical protein